ncbi:MAG: molybdenum ABC transporter substrate-binding protein, partial [Burkholderiaceae bacterium]
MTAAIKGICSMATRGLLDELAATYAKRTGVQVDFEATGGVDAARRVA